MKKINREDFMAGCIVGGSIIGMILAFMLNNNRPGARHFDGEPKRVGSWSPLGGKQMKLETENKILKEALQRFAGLVSGEAIQTDITEYKIKGSDIYVAQKALAITGHQGGVDGLVKTIGDLIDASEPVGNGDSVVPTELVEDLRDVAFGVRGSIDG